MATSAIPPPGTPAQRAYHSNLAQLGRGGAINMIGFVSSAGISFVYTYALSHLLPHSEVGLYSLGWTILNLLVIPATLGFDWGLWKFVPLLKAQGDEPGLVGLIVSMLVVVPWSVLLGVGLIILATPLAHVVFHKPALDGPLRAFGIVLPIFAIGLLCNSATQGLQDMRPSVYSKKIVEPLMRLGLSLGALACGWGFRGVLGAGIAAALAGTSLALLFLWRLIPRHVRPDRTRVPLRRLVAFAVPQTLTTLILNMLFYSDILLLGRMTSAAKVAEYWFVTQIVLLVALALTPLLPTFVPMIAALHGQGQPDQMTHVFRQVARWIVTLSLPILLTQTIYARPLLAVFKVSDASATVALVVLVCGEAWNVVTGPLTPMILMSGRTYLPLVNNVCILLLNIVLCELFIPRWGIEGAALATATSTITTNTAQLIEVWLLLRTHPFSWAYLKPLIAALIAGLCGVGIQRLARHVGLPDNTLMFGGQIGLMILVYGMALLSLGLESDDRNVLHGSLTRIPSTLLTRSRT